MDLSSPKSCFLFPSLTDSLKKRYIGLFPMLFSKQAAIRCISSKPIPFLSRINGRILTFRFTVTNHINRYLFHAQLDFLLYEFISSYPSWHNFLSETTACLRARLSTRSLIQFIAPAVHFNVLTPHHEPAFHFFFFPHDFNLEDYSVHTNFAGVLPPSNEDGQAYYGRTFHQKSRLSATQPSLPALRKFKGLLSASPHT